MLTTPPKRISMQ